MPTGFRTFKNNRVIWNSAKERTEHWIRCAGGNREWILSEVYPGREWRDRFMASTIFAAAVLGLSSEMPWTVNGRRNGAVAPNDNCFTAANEIGGGLVINCLAGGQDNDYTAVHWGDNYPTILRTSPHWHSTQAIEQVTTMAVLAGLVDNTRATGTNAFALPDNGVFFYFDTDVDAFGHLVIRSGAVSVTDTAMITPVAGEHRGVNIQTANDGNYVRFIAQGTVVVDWVDISGAAYADLRAAQLQPYYAVVNRDADILRQFHLHDFRLIMDRGF